MAEPIGLADVKKHLRVGSSTAEDSYLGALLLAARRAVELRTRRTIVGEAPTLVGDDLAMANEAILLIVGSWYTNREAATTEARSAPAELPLSASWIIDALVAWDDGSEPA